jgi:membrane protease YdiL (CAAX protease family)
MNELNSIFDRQVFTFADRAKVVGLGFSACLLWITFIRFILFHVSPLDGYMEAEVETPLHIFFFSVIVAPLWEELAFRVGPLTFARGLQSNTNDKSVLIGVTIMASAIFGWGHGFGPISILIQGVMGFIFACVYIKNGYHYWSSVILHATWNFMVCFGLPFFVHN